MQSYMYNVNLLFYFIHSSYEDNEQDCSKLLSNSTDAILIDEASLSSSDSHKVDRDLDPKPTNNTSLVAEDSFIKLDATQLNIVENSSVVSIEIPIIMKRSEDNIKYEATNILFIEHHASDSDNHVIITNPGQMENSNISGSAVSKDEINKENIVKDNLNHQKWDSQDEKAEKVTLMPERPSKRKDSGTTHGAWRFKILLIFAACCIIGFYLIPFTVYGLQSRINPEMDYSNETNASSASVRML